MALVAATAGLAAAGAGLWALRTAWRRRGGAGWIIGGWLLFGVAVAAWRATGAAGDKALAFAALVPSLAALVALAAGADWPERGSKRARAQTTAVEPPEVGASAWRGVVRLLLAGPAGLMAGTALAAAVCLQLPAAPAVRVMTAGLLLPTVWAGALVWATTDERLGRVALGLGAMTAAGLAGAWA